MMMAPDSVSHKEALVGSNFKPSGKRSIEKSCDTMATGLQPTRKALPQLLPDGLPPHLHLQAALATKHPMAYKPVPTAPVAYALKYALDDDTAMNEQRCEATKVLRELEAACKEENDELMKMCSPSVVTVLKAIGVKNVVFMREVAFACGSRDIASPALMLIGLSMIGWAPPADGLMERMRKPETSIEDFLAGREARNAKILKAMKSSGDAELDTEAYKKTLEEKERGVLCGPYASMEELPFTDVALVPRHGIWEQHGGQSRGPAEISTTCWLENKTVPSELFPPTDRRIQMD